MVSKELVNSLNEQLTNEFYASHLYLSLSAWAENKEFPGVAHWFRMQSEEEREHAMKICHFISEKGQRIVIQGIDTPPNSFKALIGAFEDAAKNEAKVTMQIYKIMDRALREKEYSTVSFLKWFIDEQVEEESLFRVIINTLKRIGNDGSGLMVFDRELGARKPDTAKSV